MKVTIHGPNLRDQSKGQFHVHTADCRDNDKEVARNGSEYPWTVEVENRVQVVEEVYEDQLNENPGVEPQDWLDDFHFAPCTKELK